MIKLLFLNFKIKKLLLSNIDFILLKSKFSFSKLSLKSKLSIYKIFSTSILFLFEKFLLDNLFKNIRFFLLF